MRSTVIVAGALAQKAGQGGLTWVYLQYLLGFKRLGYDVLFLDWLSRDACADARGRPCDPASSANAAYLVAVMEAFGLGGSYSLLLRGERRTVGLSRREVVERVRSSALLLNVMGYLDDEELLAAAPRRVFVDIDPGFGQMWRELGLHDPYPAHDAYVTVGENIGAPSCDVPTCSLDWITTPQPVVLDEWPVRDGAAGRLTSIATWRGPYGPVEYRGRTYGSRVHEFRRFMELPRRANAVFELALDIHPAEENDLALLGETGWRLVSPTAVAGDPWAYRAYIQGSTAELMIAKQMYVATWSGWFSDRSICYLASGKPVLAQDTGIGDRYPIGEGLLTFSTLEEAVAGVEDIRRDYARHCRAARALAESRFDSDRVLTRLLERLDVV